MTTADREPCDVPVPEGLGWLKPPAVCQHARGHEGMCEDGLGAHWSKTGGYGILPSRYFGRPGGAN